MTWRKRLEYRFHRMIVRMIDNYDANKRMWSGD